MSCYKLCNRCMHVVSAQPIGKGQKLMRLAGALQEFENWTLKSPAVIQSFIDHLSTCDENGCILRPVFTTGNGPRYPFWLIKVKKYELL